MWSCYEAVTFLFKGQITSQKTPTDAIKIKMVELTCGLNCEVIDRLKNVVNLTMKFVELRSNRESWIMMKTSKMDLVIIYVSIFCRNLQYVWRHTFPAERIPGTGDRSAMGSWPKMERINSTLGYSEPRENVPRRQRTLVQSLRRWTTLD